MMPILALCASVLIPGCMCASFAGDLLGMRNRPAEKPWRGALRTPTWAGAFSSPTIARVRAWTHPESRVRKAVVAQADRNFYDILGVEKTASLHDIKSAYRNMVRKYHPDVNNATDAEATFRGILAAYDVLSDEQKRSLYDERGEDGVTDLEMGVGMAGMGLQMFERFWEQRGGFSGSGDVSKDVNKVVRIDFETAMFGATQKLEVVRKRICRDCSGSTIKPGSATKICPVCAGRGVATNEVHTSLGVMISQSRCKDCGGRGHMIEEICDTCGGKGQVDEENMVTLKIPCGTSDGDKLRIVGEGDARKKKGKPPGDLCVTLRVKPDPMFEREGRTISTATDVVFWDAALGCTVEVDTIDGPEDLYIPAGTQPNDRLTLKGKGAPSKGRIDLRGDHIVTVRVSIPKNMTTEQCKLLEEIKAHSMLSAVGPHDETVVHLAALLSAVTFVMVAMLSLSNFGRRWRIRRRALEPLLHV
eukprot:gnl/TRDRNA2_/TRDRNA2_186803_c0_seq1.p1 gnl/TRDRNA2_/TRDRNA2_186803_c0~~gnl/TRDRNA2_/TRDRNA2_186803_c0_seq1.p1  ORF type:complete len:474 (+),score=76.38 gnl/TRDRNA2_/TRDRNA2_186803_c0_seq1:119-1540(+)